MKVEYEIFGKKKLVEAELHNMQEGETPEIYLWAERGEDMYALMSPEYKGKKVAVIWREAWLKAKEV